MITLLAGMVCVQIMAGILEGQLTLATANLVTRLMEHHRQIMAGILEGQLTLAF